MKKKLIIVALLACSSSAFAGTQADKRFAVTAGYSANNPGGDSLVPVTLGNGYPRGTDVEYNDDGGSATLGLSWYITPSVAIELWGAGDADNSVQIDVENAADINVATYRTRPMALSAQYHIRQFSDRLTPFVGLGYHRTQVSSIKSNPAMPQYTGLKIEDGNGVVVTAGLDVALGERWFVRADARYLRWSGQSYANNQKLADGDQHSLIYGASIGLRF